MNTVLNKRAMMKYIDTYLKDLSIEEGRTKLSLMFGYYAGQSMDAMIDGDETFTSLFNRQWKKFEEIMVCLNELRPIDFELAKSTAAMIVTARARVALGGFTHLYLRDSELSVLDVRGTTQKILGEPVDPSEMVLFFTTLDQFTDSGE